MFVDEYGRKFETRKKAREFFLKELRNDKDYLDNLAHELWIDNVDLLRWVKNNNLWERFKTYFDEEIAHAEDDTIGCLMENLEEEEN